MDIRVGAYAVVIDGDRMLMAHWSDRGRSGWTLPGGGLDPGEHPTAAVVREVSEETGYDVVVDCVLGVDAIVIAAADRIAGPMPRVALHMIQIVYRAHVVGGELRHELDGTTDEAAWVRLADIASLDRVGLVDVAVAMNDAETSAATTLEPTGM